MLSKKLPLLLSLAVAFTFCACDSSTSASTNQEEIDSSTSGEKVPGSSDSTTPDEGGTESSSASNGNTNSGNTDSGDTDSSDTNSGDTNVNSSDSKKTDYTLDGQLNERQAKVLEKLKDFVSTNEESKELTESCTDGEKATEVLLGQTIEFTCVYESWVPTSGMKEFFESLDPSVQGMILENTGMTEEELNDFIDFIANLDPTKNDIGVTCEGELNDNSWHVSLQGLIDGVLPVLAEGTTTFDGTTMTTSQSLSMDLYSEALCNKFIQDNADDEEDDDDPDYIYGVVTYKVASCRGQYYVEYETKVKEDVSDNDRADVYKDMVQSCKDYRDGKITFEELMEN